LADADGFAAALIASEQHQQFRAGLAKVIWERPSSS
jgi:hypothetical protein